MEPHLLAVIRSRSLASAAHQAGDSICSSRSCSSLVNIVNIVNSNDIVDVDANVCVKDKKRFKKEIPKKSKKECRNFKKYECQRSVAESVDSQGLHSVDITVDKTTESVLDTVTDTDIPVLSHVSPPHPL